MMDNQHTKQDVYEAYVDASVALLMQRYCDILDENIAGTDGSSAEGDGAAFPKALYDRCTSLIKRSMKRRKFRQAMRYAGKTAFSLCCAVIVSVALLSVLFITVDAVRVPIISYFISKSDNNYLEIRPSRSAVDETKSFDPADPLDGLITDEYILLTQEVVSEFDFYALYEGTDNSQVYVKARPLSVAAGIDLEGADSVEEFYLYNCATTLVTEGADTRIMIVDEEHFATFTFVFCDAFDLDALEIADDFLRIISE